METTITVNLDEAVVQLMNDYAIQNNTTLSEIINNYALSLKKPDHEYHKWLNSLEQEIREMIGVVSVEDKYRNMDTKELISLLRNEANLEENLYV